MIRLNLVLLLAVLVSAFYLVHVQYDSRRLYTALDRKGEPGKGAIRPNGDIVITAAAVTNGGAISAQKSIQLSATSLPNDSGTEKTP